jgi:hypothetical protein
MHEGELVLVGFMWYLSVLIRLFSLFSLRSDWLSSSAIFSENDEDTLQSLPLNVRDQMYVTKLSCTCRKRIKGRRKQNKRKQNKRNKVRYKKREKRKEKIK